MRNRITLLAAALCLSAAAGGTVWAQSATTTLSGVYTEAQATRGAGPVRHQLRPLPRLVRSGQWRGPGAHRRGIHRRLDRADDGRPVRPHPHHHAPGPAGQALARPVCRHLGLHPEDQWLSRRPEGFGQAHRISEGDRLSSLPASNPTPPSWCSTPRTRPPASPPMPRPRAPCAPVRRNSRRPIWRRWTRPKRPRACCRPPPTIRAMRPAPSPIPMWPTSISSSCRTDAISARRSSVAGDSKGHIWVAERCGANNCVGSPLNPVVEFDAKGNYIKSFGAG